MASTFKSGVKLYRRDATLWNLFPSAWGGSGVHKICMVLVSSPQWLDNCGQ